jgi:hypothetical protein
MKTCTRVVAVALALMAGSVSNQTIGDAKVGSGTVPKTRLIMASLKGYRAMPYVEELR